MKKHATKPHEFIHFSGIRVETEEGLAQVMFMMDNYSGYIFDTMVCENGRQDDELIGFVQKILDLPRVRMDWAIVTVVFDLSPNIEKDLFQAVNRPVKFLFDREFNEAAVKEARKSLMNSLQGIKE